MRLHGTHKQTVYGTRYRDVLRTTSADDDSFATVGQLPSPTTGWNSLTYRLKTERYWKTSLAGVVGSFPLVNVWPLSEAELIAATIDGFSSLERRWRNVDCQPRTPGVVRPDGRVAIDSVPD